MEYFIDSIIKVTDNSLEQATHFAIYNGDKAKYYIALDAKSAGKRLKQNISSYSGKLGMFLSLLGVVSYRAFAIARIGKFVKLEVCSEVIETFEIVRRDWLQSNEVFFNVIIGNYVEKQKLVFQCFSNDNIKEAYYIKTGGKNSDFEMNNETSYLEHPIYSELFDNPVLFFRRKIGKGTTFNIQVTKEFKGRKVDPVMTPEIYGLFKEIAGSAIVEGRAFSHGDFTPWNIKRQDNGKYIIFDWEYCGQRFYGFDLIHYIWQVENKLNRKNKKEAIHIAIQTAKKFDINLRKVPDELIANMYFIELKRQFGEIL